MARARANKPERHRRNKERNDDRQEDEADRGRGGTWRGRGKEENRIGVAFENRDGSFNLKFDYVPARLESTTIQLRDFDPKEA